MTNHIDKTLAEFHAKYGDEFFYPYQTPKRLAVWLKQKLEESYNAGYGARMLECEENDKLLASLTKEGGK